MAAGTGRENSNPKEQPRANGKMYHRSCEVGGAGSSVTVLFLHQGQAVGGQDRAVFAGKRCPVHIGGLEGWQVST